MHTKHPETLPTVHPAVDALAPAAPPTAPYGAAWRDYAQTRARWRDVARVVAALPFLNPDLDTRDAASLADYVAAFWTRATAPVPEAGVVGPMVGEWVIFATGEVRRITNVHEGGYERLDGTTVPGYAQSGMGRFHLSRGGHMSYSGSLASGTPLANFTYTGATRPGSAWIWNHGRARADGGVDVMVPARVWQTSDIHPDVEYVRRVTHRARVAGSDVTRCGHRVGGRALPEVTVADLAPHDAPGNAYTCFRCAATI